MIMRRVFNFVLAISIFVTYRLLSRLWRVTQVRLPHLITTNQPYIGGHWHGDELLLLSAFAGKGMAVLSSRSRDGELMARILRWLGFYVIRGSSSRGGAGALKGLIDVVSKNRIPASLAVDGPRGPIHKVKPGILKLATETGLPIILGAASASRKFIFKNAWNRCYLPLPFSRCVVVYSAPVSVPSGLSPIEVEKFRERLENQLLELKREADRYFEPTPIPLPQVTGCSAGG